MNKKIDYISFAAKWVFLLTFLLSFPTLQAAPIGSWKAYMAYHEVTEIEKGGHTLYVLASKSLYCYNTQDNSIQTFDKANSLSDCEIEHIAWCQTAHSLLILYANNNMDILSGNGTVTNVPAYYNFTTSSDKTINDVYVYGSNAYLATGFGIVNINMKAKEISNTYNLGFKVDYCYINGNNIFAASSTQGLYSAPLSANLLDKNNWKRTGEYTPRQKTVDPELLATVKVLNPGGPKYNFFEYMKFVDGKLYTCGGGYNTIDDSNRPGMVQVLQPYDDQWQIYQDQLDTITGVKYISVNCLAVDPLDSKHVFASGKNGLYEFYDGKFLHHFNEDNSPIVSVYRDNNHDYTFVFSVIFDNTGNLWLYNSFNDRDVSLLEFTKEREWKSFPHKEMRWDGTHVEKAIRQPMWDSRGLLWTVNEDFEKQCFNCYQPSTDAVKVYDKFVNEDGENLTFSDGNYGFHCIAEDKEGNIWVGSTLGPLYLSAENIASGNETLTQVKVPRNDGTNYADYLLANVQIMSMAVDGAGRKWFGTNGNGVYLISQDNMTQIHHFLTTNSDLISNVVKSIAIDERTGEVFFGTDKGLCSYMSDATATNEEMTKDNVYAYPNPVRPGYEGNITIVGLSYNADVKIATTSGTLVAQGKSTGGSFVWDGRDGSGKKVASGIYMVETAKSDGSKGTVCKIAIVR